ncbi:DUF992 domain-containing protein [Methylobacterium oxalidis]|uniref:DUF992 domain-containing protein n=1 Tax=Methylobacterium oxalidis TaxID=944322 RepID=A0A512IZG0_9HYPH|nr:DUF992 domain-containing protein [Methylobacterium oxalidis]GEP03101.1 hypothetical protein MOX02_11390 [Methylobacterium oxalidis]GJE31738.1 hypothetical protein LDDCCGHA_1918 [Methylobacterium oxalidis]GLS67360.1 hypothetical protein GCM10007888_57440 [Methylobacterium oxalidis]
MRSEVIAFSVAATCAVLIATAPYARGTLTEVPSREAGTLTCTRNGDLGLVVGLTPVADCIFAPAGEGARQSYRALFERGAALPAGPLAWRVMTETGTSRPGQLDGLFTASLALDEGGRARDAAVVIDLRGEGAVLRRIGRGAGEPATLVQPRLRLAAEPAPARAALD